MSNTDPLRGAETLLEAHGLITGPRQAVYDHPYEDYSKVTDIFEALTGVRLTIEQALLFMVSVKFARLRTNLERGDLHRDSLVDAMGYLGCLAMVRTRVEQNRTDAQDAIAKWKRVHDEDMKRHGADHD